jgi:hypothetical protein
MMKRRADALRLSCAARASPSLIRWRISRRSGPERIGGTNGNLEMKLIIDDDLKVLAEFAQTNFAAEKLVGLQRL